MILKIDISTCDISRINCSMRTKTECTVSDLVLTTKNYTFVPIAPDSKAVTKFIIKNSKVSVLTTNICTAFTKLQKLNAIDSHIEIVEGNAFQNCTDIIEINLEQNNIHQLGEGVFSNTKKLQNLHILGGSLRYIDADLFSNLGELQLLLFSANGLEELPVATIKNLKKLKKLFLYSNDLYDLDAAGLIENLPSLEEISINDNNLHCDRLIEIIETFKAKNITIQTITHDLYVKKRNYNPNKMDKIICLSQAQQDDEKFKNALRTRTLDELRDFPLGKTIIDLQTLVYANIVGTDRQIKDLTNTLNTVIANISSHYEIGNHPGESLNLNVIAYWISLASLLLIIVAIGINVHKKLENEYTAVPLLNDVQNTDLSLPIYQDTFT